MTTNPLVRPKTELKFSNAFEDPITELRVLERVGESMRRPLRVLVMASGGCTALTLLGSPLVGRLDVVDPNRGHLRLLALKLAALLRYSTEDYITMFGGRPGGNASERVRLYQGLRKNLEPDIRDYWDARPTEIEFGLERAGRFQGLFARLTEAFQRHGLDPVARPAEALTDKSWPALFAEAFSNDLVEEALGAAALVYGEEPLSRYLAPLFARVLLRYAPRNNYFLHLALTGYYPEGDANLPPYFAQKDVIEQLGIDRIRLHEGKLGPQLNILTAIGQFDVIDTGSETDWMPREGLRHLFARAAEALNPGGAIISRRMNGKYVLAEELGAALPLDEALAAELAAQDRSFIYREIGIAFKPL